MLTFEEDDETRRWHLREGRRAMREVIRIALIATPLLGGVCCWLVYGNVPLDIIPRGFWAEALGLPLLACGSSVVAASLGVRYGRNRLILSPEGLFFRGARMAMIKWKSLEGWQTEPMPDLPGYFVFRVRRKGGMFYRIILPDSCAFGEIERHLATHGHPRSTPALFG